MADMRKLTNRLSQSEQYEQFAEQKRHPLSQLVRRACSYSKDHPFLALSILGAIASEAYFQGYTENQVELGLQQSNLILAKRFGYTPFDLSDTPFLVMTKSIAWFATACNFSNDFLFLRPNDFIEGYENAFPGGFRKGLGYNIKYMFSSPKNFLKVTGPLLANLGAFAALSYSDVMTWDNPDSQGGNSASMTALLSFIFYGGVFNYFMTQGSDTNEGAKFIFGNLSQYELAPMSDKELKSNVIEIECGENGLHYRVIGLDNVEVPGFIKWYDLPSDFPRTTEAVLENKEGLLAAIQENTSRDRNTSKNYYSLWHHFWRTPGMKATVFQTELVRESQNIMRGVLGGFLVKFFLESRNVLSDSYTMKFVPPLFGFATAVQSFLARNPVGYKRNIGPEKMGDRLLYRYDECEIQALQDRFLKDKDFNAENRCKRYWHRYSRLLNPVCLAETGMFSYFVSKLANLLPESMEGLPKDYIAPGILGLTVASIMFKIFYKADIRKEISRKLEEEAKGKPEESRTSKFADWFAYISVVGAFTARTINGVPAMISFGEYLPFLSDMDKTILAYTLGVLVNVAGYQYYYPKVRQSTQEVMEFIKECFASPCCRREVSDNRNTLFGKNTSINDSDFLKNAKEPLLKEAFTDSDEIIDFSVTSARGVTSSASIV